ncbi:hypothetical protein FDY98_00230 [Halomonas sp. PA16-9]|nr:hypothetical protein FDY98_00230 [Halomonas sp. PA16-9]
MAIARISCSASRLTPHASRLTPHASRLTPHASRLTPHASRLTLTCGFTAFYVRMHSSRRNAHDSDALGTVTFPTSSSRSTLNKYP